MNQSTTTTLNLTSIEDKLTAMAIELLPRIRVGDDVSDLLLGIYIALFQARQSLQDVRLRVAVGEAAA